MLRRRLLLSLAVAVASTCTVLASLANFDSLDQRYSNIEIADGGIRFYACRAWECEAPDV